MRLWKSRGVLFIAVVGLSSVVLGGVAEASYSGTSAAHYADLWYGGFNLNYNNFPSDDCTNFVSQAMVNGGFPINRGLWTNESYFYNDTLSVYNNSPALQTQDGREESITGTVAVSLYRYFQSSSNAAYVGSYSYLYNGSPPRYMPSSIVKGDVLFYAWTQSAGITHTNMMVGSGTDSGGYTGDWIDQHSNPLYHDYWILLEQNPNWQSEFIWYYHLS